MHIFGYYVYLCIQCKNSYSTVGCRNNIELMSLMRYLGFLFHLEEVIKVSCACQDLSRNIKSYFIINCSKIKYLSEINNVVI